MSGHYICEDCGYDGGDHANYCRTNRPVDERWKGNFTRKELGIHCRHKWSAWEIVSYTGDWFHPRAVKRRCEKCGCTETDEH